jgi:hypothetical protein
VSEGGKRELQCTIRREGERGVREVGVPLNVRAEGKRRAV